MKNVLFILFCSLEAHSASLTVSELASLAVERAPLIRMQFEGASAAKSQIHQSKMLSNPQLSIQSGSLHSGDQSGGVIDVTINQPMPWPGKKFAEVNSSKILEKIAEVDLDESRLLVNHSISLLGIEFAVLDELEKHNQERKHRFSIIHQFLISRPMASPRQRVEKNLIETQIKLVESQMFDLETKKKSLKDQLSQFSGVAEPEVTVNWNRVPAPRSKELFVAELENGPRHLRATKMVELAKNKIEQAKFLAKPDVLLGLNYRQENVFPANHFYHANLAVVIPIMDQGKYSVEIASANARREEASRQLVQMNSLAELNQLYQALLSAYKSTELFRVSDLKRNDQQFREAEDAFKKGRIDVTTFLQTDMQIHDSIDLAFLSFIKYYTALSKMSLLAGKKLEIQ
jgi:outer membrane protein TolC